MKRRIPSAEYDWEEQLNDPWTFQNAREHLDGWKVNHNPILSSKFLLELDRELGPITIPHKYRRLDEVTILDNDSH